MAFGSPAIGSESRGWDSSLLLLGAVGQHCAWHTMPSLGISRETGFPLRACCPQVLSFFLSLAMLHSMWDLIPGPRIAYAPPSLEASSLNHWIARKVPSPGLTSVSSPYLGEGSIGPSAGTSGGTLVPVSFMTENGPLKVNELEHSRTVRACRQLPKTAGLWAACSGPLLRERLSRSLFLPLSRTDFLKQNCCLYF